ncbi:MAG TPA: putative glycoside hydrolase, partial [Exilispira sp.]|nr:putative glycoside hydrolase [Exilispira sp.]
CWYKISRHIGQDIFLDSQILDAIYPMYYPSHFSDGFYEKGLGQPDTVRLIYQHGTIRAMENSNYNISIRPWIQAFNLKVKIDMVSYIINEIKGVKEAGINSYIFWNPSCKYSFLYEVFRDKSLKF